MEPASLSKIRKTFREGEVIANDDASLSLTPGRIHAIVGENGAGKTTLMRVLAGLEKPDSGHIEIGGRTVAFASPAEARRAGIGMVHQHFMTIPGFSVAENILFGAEPRRWGFIDRAELKRRAKAVAAKAGFDIDMEASAAETSVGTRQQIEILRLLAQDCELLIFDEPTSVLNEVESRALFKTLRDFATRGKSIALVTHKVRDVLEIADEVTVMRSGRTIGTFAVPSITRGELTSLMMGEKSSCIDARQPETRAPESVVLSAKSLRAAHRFHGKNGKEILQDVSFDIRAGEIVGICGVADGGLKELEDILSGMSKPSGGSVYLYGKPMPALRSAPWAKGGFAYIPSDRTGRGVCQDRQVWEHFPALDRKTFFTMGVLDREKAKAKASHALRRFAPEETALRQSGELSGGMIQRSILARELSDPNPEYCLACEPSWGLDMATTEKAWESLRKLKRAGTAVSLVSTNLDEILELSDRIIVLRSGRIAAILDNSEEVDRHVVGSLMLDEGARHA